MRFPARHVLLMLVWMLTACTPDRTVTYSYRSVAAQGWHADDTLFFSTQLSDSLCTYRLTIEARHREGYPFRNLAVGFFIQSETSGSLCLADSIECLLYDERGHWFGQGWSGLYTRALPSRTFRIPHAGSYRIGLYHRMQEFLLPDLSDMGIKIESVP